MKQEVISEVTTSSKDPLIENEMNLFATTQALWPKPFVDRGNDNGSVEQRVLTLQTLIF